MPRIMPDRLAPLTVSRAGGRWLPILLAVMSFVLPLSPLLAAGQVVIENSPVGAGSIDFPEPSTPESRGKLPPGCTVTFRRGPGLLGPPCAIECTGTARKAFDSMDYQAVCDSISENSYGVSDENGGSLPPGGEFDPDNGCIVDKGNAGQTVGRVHYPNGSLRCLGVRGEPHLESFDGLRFDLQAAGEFTVAKSLDDDFEVQMRLEPYVGTSDRLSVVTAIAARVGPHRVTINVKEEEPLRVDGKTLELEELVPHELSESGALLVREGRRYSIVLADGTNVHADLFSTVMNFYVPLAEDRDGRMVGIAGNADGDDGSNDFRTRDGRLLASPPAFETLYEDFAEGWRVTPETTLFDYAPGESTETFTNRDMPVEPIALDDLDPADRARAEMACRDAGLRSGPALEECVFDHALTGDEVFIQSALSQQSPPEFVVDPDEVSIDAPSTAFAAHRVTLRIHGPIERGYWLGFAPRTSPSSGQAANPYSAKVLKGDEEEVDLAVPMAPGEYELRYRERSGDATIALRAPFESVAPVIEITAEDSARAGGELDLTVTGDIGEHMVVTVVPAGSDPNERGPSLSLRQGTEHSGTVRRLPEEPGDYEIRCITGYGRNRVVFARRKLVIR